MYWPPPDGTRADFCDVGQKGVHLKDSKRTLFGLGNAEFPSPEGPGYFRVDSSASRTACFWRAEVCTLGRRASQ